MLFITGTTLSVPSLMGAIMAVGVASANSILLVTFAREQQLAGKTAFEAAIAAGHTRIRPVLMTAAAMIVGMIPMAIGGAGEEQNAALARAVIGGLLFATPTTLLVVPYLFAMLRKGNDGKTGARRLRRGLSDERRQPPSTASEPTADRDSEKPPTSLAGQRAPERLVARARRVAASRRRPRLRRLAALSRNTARSLATAEQHRDFVPTFASRRCEPSDGIDARHAAGHHRRPSQPANIFARASGYIAKRDVDIGDHVKDGQLLAEITAPELDHQIAQAEATLAQLKAALQQAQANRDLAQVTWDRDKPLVEQGLGHRSSRARSTSRRSRRRRRRSASRRPTSRRRKRSCRCCNQQKVYQQVVAPFDGVITQRNIDVGSLVQADATSGTFMFTIMQSDVIRIQVYRAAGRRRSAWRPGVEAVVRVPEIPGPHLSGHGDADRRCAAAGHAHPADRDRRSQSRRRADARDLLHGRAANPAQDAVLVPAEAIIFNGDGRRSPGRGRRRPHPQNYGGARLGNEVEVSDGVKEGDQVILNPPVDLVEGSKVHIRPNYAKA